MKRVHLHIHGDVTGVGFRAWTVRQARQLQLTGWVRNESPDIVEAVAEGMKEALEEFLARSRQGPEVAWVDDVRVTWGGWTGEFEDFQIIS